LRTFIEDSSYDPDAVETLAGDALSARASARALAFALDRASSGKASP
jgi:hypothetical protein